MTTALWGVLLLTLAGGAHAADDRAGARAAATGQPPDCHKSGCPDTKSHRLARKNGTTIQICRTD
ncbi:MAG TPA: hypothetical protein VIQ01_07095 [Burkholderiales bacterium]